MPPSSYAAFVLEPHSVEFYSGGSPFYFNDRFYVRRGSGGWVRATRAPSAIVMSLPIRDGRSASAGDSGVQPKCKVTFLRGG